MRRSVKKLFLYIDSMQFGGAQRVMNNIGSYFVENSYEVTLINDIVPDPNAPEYEIDPRIHRVYLDEGNEEGKKTKNFYRIGKLRKYIKQHQPQVVLSFLGPPNIRMLIATIGLKIKKYVSVRNDPYREYGNGLHKIIANMVFCLADGCVFQTRDASMYFSKAVRKKSRIIVNPVNEKFYCIAWTGEKKEIAVVGRLQPQKNPLLALNAFAKVAREFPEYKLVYYGDEDLKSEIIDKSNEYGIENQVVVYGKASDIETKLATSTIFLLSSDYEGMPNALLEAMAVGIPVISTDCPCGGPRTVIENANQGILVPVGDAEKMAVALRKLLMNREIRLHMHREERERAKEFRFEKIMLEWKQYIEA